MGAMFGPYELLVELGRGGIGTVDIALQRGAASFQRLVVVKRIHRFLAGDPELAKMTLDEAHLASQVRHANVVPVIDVIEHDGEIALAMDYVEGVTLAALLAKCDQKRLPIAIAVRILCDVLAGLHAAHEASDLHGESLAIVHRDVSPQNILIGVDGISRVIDFGIAKGSSRHARTTTGQVKGKLVYMSPEQVESLPIDRRADLFAAGLVLYETLTGVRPFAADNDGAIIRRILDAEIPPLSAYLGDVPSGLEAIVAKALLRPVEDRVPTAEVFARALEEAVRPASHREVAAAMKSVNGGELAEVRARIDSALASRSDPNMVVARESAASSPRVVSTVAANEVERQQPRSRLPMLLLAIGLPLLILIGGIVALLARPSPSIAIVPAAASAGAATASIARTMDPPSAAPSAPPLVSADAPATPPSGAPSSAQITPSPARRDARPNTKPRPTAPGSSRGGSELESSPYRRSQQ